MNGSIFSGSLRDRGPGATSRLRRTAAVDQEDLLRLGVDAHRFDPVEVRRAAAASRENVVTWIGIPKRRSNTTAEALSGSHIASRSPSAPTSVPKWLSTPRIRGQRMLPVGDSPSGTGPKTWYRRSNGSSTKARVHRRTATATPSGIVDPSLALPRDHRVHAPLVEERAILEPVHRDPMVQLVGDEEPVARDRQIDGRVEQSRERPPVPDRSDLLAVPVASIRTRRWRSVSASHAPPSGEAHDPAAPRVRGSSDTAAARRSRGRGLAVSRRDRRRPRPGHLRFRPRRHPLPVDHAGISATIATLDEPDRRAGTNDPRRRSRCPPIHPAVACPPRSFGRFDPPSCVKDHHRSIRTDRNGPGLVQSVDLSLESPQRGRLRRNRVETVRPGPEQEENEHAGHEVVSIGLHQVTRSNCGENLRRMRNGTHPGADRRSDLATFEVARHRGGPRTGSEDRTSDTR